MMSELKSWENIFKVEEEQSYFKALMGFLEGERSQGKKIYPQSKDVFSAFHFTPFRSVKVVILGQDPYHGPEQAHGLAFSVKPSIQIPPSLQNIYKELNADLGIPVSNTGYLKSWAEQGVLLLNAVLTVEDGKPGAHADIGWEKFTDKVILELGERRENLVFMLWGAYAQKKAKRVDSKKHLILNAPHPSPLSAYRGFLGCRHFSRANQYLSDMGIEEVDWELPRLVT